MLSLGRVFLLYDVAGIIPQALSAGQSINQGPAGDCLEASSQSSVEEAVTGPLEESVCKLVDVIGVEVLHPLVLGRGRELGAKVLHCLVQQMRLRVVQSCVQLCKK